RDFIGSLAALGLLRLRPAAARPLPARAAHGPSLLVPLDDAQANHLKAYGVVFHPIERGGHCEWLLNYPGRSFLRPAESQARRAAALGGVTLEPVDDGAIATIHGEIEQQNMDAVPLERAPRVAIYSPPNANPWDDAVTMALQYAD